MVFVLALLPLYVGHARSVIVPFSGNVPNNVEYGLNTTILVDAGSIMSFSSSGQWFVCSEIVTCASGPAGIPGTGIYPNTTIPFVPLGTLIGNVSGCLFVIGNTSSVVSPCTGTLFLLMNDFDYHDNVPMNLTVNFSVVGFLTIASTTATTTSPTTIFTDTSTAVLTGTTALSGTTSTGVVTSTTATTTADTTTSVATETTAEETTTTETTSESLTTTTETTTETVTSTEVPTTTTETVTSTEVPTTTTETVTSTEVPTTTTETTTETTTSTAVPTTTTETSTTTTGPITTTVISPTIPPVVNVQTTYSSLDTKDGNKYASGYHGTGALAVKFDSNDSIVWYSTTNSGTAFSVFNSMRVAQDDNLYAAGFVTQGLHDFGNGVVVNGTTPNNQVLVKYSTFGIAQWAVTTNSSTNAQFYATAVNGVNEIYCVGYYPGAPSSIDYGNGVVLSGTGYVNSATTGVLVKYNSTGHAQWARSEISTGNGYSVWQGVAVNTSDGSVYVCGYIWTPEPAIPHDFGNGVILITDVGARQVQVLIKYDASGNALWVRSPTFTQQTFAFWHAFSSIAIASDGHLYAAGSLGGAPLGRMYFGSITSESCTQTQVLVVKYTSSGTALWVKTNDCPDPPQWSQFFGVSVGPTGNVYGVGHSYNNVYRDWGFGNGVTIHPNVRLEYSAIIVGYSSNGTTLWAKTPLAGVSYSVAAGVVAVNSRVYYAGGMSSTNVIFDANTTDRGTFVGGGNRFLVNNNET
jgi:hypothetical protein